MVLDFIGFGSGRKSNLIGEFEQSVSEEKLNQNYYYFGGRIN